ncbi:MAG TPA: hypothetical protein VFW98_03405 [Gemmatimonadaceae bacterium]|nr:hypothetical protein [Gemmatimonadaceae bacterium]
MPAPLTLRRPIPLERSIRWVPAATPASIGGVETQPLFITQDTLRDLLGHVRGLAVGDVLGFLLGELYECPESGARYAIITAVVHTNYVIGEAEPMQIPDEEWLGIQLEVRRRRLTLIGWYHTAPFVAPGPARADLDAHRARFTEPWQCGLVIAAGGAQRAGGFFRTWQGESVGGAFIPFHELLDEGTMTAGGPRPTVINWRNYTTDVPVEREVGTPSPGGRTVPASSGSATVPVLIPTRSGTEPGAPGPPRRRRVPAGMWAILVLVAAGIAAWLYWTHRPRPSLFANTTAAASKGQAAHPTPPPAQPAPETVAAQRETAAAQPGSTITAAPPAGAVLQMPAASHQPPVADASLARFDSLADSLAQAVANYHDRRTDFNLGRIACAGLARGYRAADDALLALASAYRTASPRLANSQRATYQRLTADMESLNKDFDGSKCPRP